MNRRQFLDIHYLQSRANLIDLATFLDCLDRFEGEADSRQTEFMTAVAQLCRAETFRTERILGLLSIRKSNEFPPPPLNMPVVVDHP